MDFGRLICGIGLLLAPVVGVVAVLMAAGVIQLG